MGGTLTPLQRSSWCILQPQPTGQPSDQKHITCLFKYPHLSLSHSPSLSLKHTYTHTQHPMRHQLYGHLPPITKTIQVRRTRHARHCWRSKDELVSDVLLWTPTYGRAKAGRPARTYIQQLCEDTGCCPEDLPEAMNDREKWRERVRDIRAGGTTWWWWYIYIYIYIYIYHKIII